jgi:hypothetical protein
MPGMLAEPREFADARSPLRDIAARLALLPAAPEPVGRQDGGIEALGNDGVPATHRSSTPPGTRRRELGVSSRSAKNTTRPSSSPRGPRLVVSDITRCRHWRRHTTHCAAVDLKGYVESTRRTGDLRQESVADQLINLLVDMGVDRFSLVSHDHGTPPADHLVAKLGTRVTRYGRRQQHLWHLHPSLHPQKKRSPMPRLRSSSAMHGPPSWSVTPRS